MSQVQWNNTEERAQVRKYLKKVQLLLSDNARWCKGSAAKLHKRGKSIDLSKADTKTCSFCMTGAVAMTVPPKYISKVSEAVMTNLPDGYTGIITFNDASKTRHSQVLRVLDKAIDSTYVRSR